MDIKILWVSEKPVDYEAIRRQFPLFKQKFEGFAQEPKIFRRKDDGVFRMPAKAGTIRVCARCNDRQGPDDYFIHIRDIRQMATDLGCSAIVLDHESAPWPLVSWLAKNDFSESSKADANEDYDGPQYIPVFVHWHGNLYFVANLELMEE